MKTASFNSVSQQSRFWITLFLLFFVLCVSSISNAMPAVHLEVKESVVPDSVGVEIRDGKQVILHKLMPKETYYGLSRKYQVDLNDLITFNSNKPLKIGDIILVPTLRAAKNQPTVSNTTATPVNTSKTPAQTTEYHLNPGEFTEYKVGKGETLFAVSRRFGIPVASIKLANGMEDDNLKENTLLRVPHKAIVEEMAAAVEEQNAVPLNQVIDSASLIMNSQVDVDAEVKKNRYGVREVIEKGLGVWMDDLNPEGANMLVLHKTAQIGTVIKITNPMSGHSTFAKVVGKFVDSSETQGAIIVLSKSVANVIGILDKRFQVEIAYGAPLDI